MLRSSLRSRESRRDFGCKSFRSPKVLRAAGAVMAAMLSTGAFPQIGQAATDTWTGNADANWNTTSVDWLIGSTPSAYTNGDFVVFPDVAGHFVVNIGGPGSLTVSPSGIEVDNDATGTTVVSGTNVYSGGLYLFQGTGSIGGAATLTETGGGGLTIENTASNTYSGATTILDGALNVVLGSAVSTNLISSSSALTLSGAGLQITSSNAAVTAQTFNGLTISPGASGVTVMNGTSTSTLTLGTIIRSTAGGTVNFVMQNSNASTLVSNSNTNGILGGWATMGSGLPNSPTAVTNWAAVTAGAITAPLAAAVVTNTWSGSSTNVVMNASTPEAANATTNSVLFPGSTPNVTVALSGATNTITSGGILVSTALNGAAEVITGGSLTSGAADLIVNEFDASGTLTIASQVVNNSSIPLVIGVTESGPGTLVLSNNTNTYTGATFINNGIISVSKLSAGGSASGIGQSVNAANDLQFNGGTLEYTGAGDTTDRLFTLGPKGGTINASGTGALTFSNAGSVVFANPTNPSAVTFTLTGISTASNTFSPALADPGLNQNVLSLIKNGPGTWILPNANTYSGGTTINAGALSVTNTSGSATGSGAVTVNATGSLGGSGSVGGAVTVNSGGFITPGDANNFTINNSLSLLSGANLAYALNQPNVIGTAGGNDLTTVTGNLTINPNLTVDITPGASFNSGTYTLIHYNTLTDNSSSFTGWNPDFTSTPTNFVTNTVTFSTMAFTNDATGKNIDLTMSAPSGTAPGPQPPSPTPGPPIIIVVPPGQPIGHVTGGGGGNAAAAAGALNALNVNIPAKNGNIGGNGGAGGNNINFNFFLARGPQVFAKAFAINWAPAVVQIVPGSPYFNVDPVVSATQITPDPNTFASGANLGGWAYAGLIPTVLGGPINSGPPNGGSAGLADTGLPYALVNAHNAAAPFNVGAPAAYANAVVGPIPGNVWLPAFTIAPIIIVADPPATPVPTYYGETFDPALAPMPIDLKSIHLSLENTDDALATGDDSLSTGSDAVDDYQGTFLSLVQADFGSGITDLSQLTNAEWSDFDGSYGEDLVNDVAWAVDDVPNADYTVIGLGVPEPSTLALLGATAGGLLMRRRRREI